MKNIIKNWFDIHDDELRLFIWSFVLLFLIRSAGIVFNNFAETAFLKRYGVEYLPVVYMLNSIITFVIMGLLAGIMTRMEGIRLFSYILFFCGVSVAALRPIIQLNFDLLYPLLFILKAQYGILLGLLFWNLANDLFNIRQSKRLFPLIIAGGVVGEIIGSFFTPILGAAISIDNLMLVYGFIIILAIIAVNKMRFNYSTITTPDTRQKKPGSRPPLIKQIHDISSLIRETPLITILIILTLIPNIIIPILNYQFNYAVSIEFPTETGMIGFFGYFRGFMNIISLLLLLFIGKTYNRLGLPVALMFHPVNYLLVFMAFLFRFDIFSAMYARLSTNIIRTTFNKPVIDILMGIFPSSYRSKIRLFLRSTVVRIALFTGSGLILISDGWFHPKYLSLVVLPFVGVWIATTLYLKKNYSKIFSGLISKDMINLKSMEENDVKNLFKGKETQDLLVETFLSTRNEDSLWYARLLKSLSIENLDAHILSIIKNQNDKTKIGLLELISEEAGDDAVQIITEIADIENQDLFVAIVYTLKRMHSDVCIIFSEKMVGTDWYPEARAYASSCLYGSEPDKYHEIIISWLNSNNNEEKKTGVVAAGESGDKTHIKPLKAMLASEEDSKLISSIIKALYLLKVEGMNNLAMPYFFHNKESVRLAALDAIRIIDDQTLQSVITLLADHSNLIQKKAKEKIQIASYHNGRLLIESLKIPNKNLRDNISSLLETLAIKKLDTFLFVQNQVEKSYVNLQIIETLIAFKETTGRNLLKEHLEYKTHENIETLFRVLSIQDTSGQIRIVFRSLFSQNDRQKANALEALDSILKPSLLKPIMPLVDGTSPSKALVIGRKKFDLPDFKSELSQLFLFLLKGECWVCIVIVLYCLQEEGAEIIDLEIVHELTRYANPIIRKEAKHLLNFQQNPVSKEKNMESALSTTEIILHLKKIDIFKKLSVNELAEIALITKKVVYPPGKIVFNEGDTAETIYLIIQGKLSVFKNEIEMMGKLVSGDSFGTMALLLDDVRLLTARTETASQLLVIHKHDFEEIVREYPQIALEISKVMAENFQRLVEKLSRIEGTVSESVIK